MAASGAIYGAGKPHPQVDAHPLLPHDAVQVRFVGFEFEVGEETERAERKGEDRGNDPLKQPGGMEDRPIATQGDDKIKLFRGSPAKVRRPVFKHLRVPRVGRYERSSIEPFRIAKLCVDIDVDAKVRIIPWSLEKPFRELPGEIYKAIVTSFSYNHDIMNSASDRSSLELLRYFSHACGCLD